MNWLLILTATLTVSYGDIDIDKTTTSPFSAESGQTYNALADEFNMTSTSTPYDHEFHVSATTRDLDSTLEIGTSLASEFLTKPETYEIPNVERSRLNISLSPTTESIYQDKEVKEVTLANLKEDYTPSTSDVDIETITTAKSLEELSSVSLQNFDISHSSQIEPVPVEYKIVETDEHSVQTTEIPVSLNHNQDHLGVSLMSSKVIPESTENTIVGSSSVSLIQILEMNGSGIDITLSTTTEAIYQDTEVKEVTLPSSNEDHDLPPSDFDTESITTVKFSEKLVTVPLKNSEITQRSATEPATEDFNEVKTNKHIILTTDIPVSLNHDQEHLNMSNLPSNLIPESTENTIDGSSLVSLTPISQMKRSEKVISLSPTTETTYQGMETKEVTLATLKKDHKLTSSDYNSQSITTVKSLEELGTVSSGSSKIFQNSQTEFSTKGYKEVKTVKNILQTTELPTSSLHLTISSIPLKEIEVSTEVNNLEFNSISVTPIFETSQQVQTQSSSIVSQITKENDAIGTESEIQPSLPVQTESNPMLSHGSSPLLVPEKSHVSIEQTTMRDETTSPLLEILGSTVTQASEEPMPSLHLLIPDLPGHVTVINRVPSVNQLATIIHQENIRHTNGSYKHGYETSNGILFNEVGIPRVYNKTDVKSGEPVQNIVVAGAFGWTAPDGQKVGIKYYADETGYHPEGDILPTPPPSPPQILKALAWIRKVLAEKKLKESKLNSEHSEN